MGLRSTLTKSTTISKTVHTNVTEVNIAPSNMSSPIAPILVLVGRGKLRKNFHSTISLLSEMFTSNVGKVVITFCLKKSIFDKNHLRNSVT